MNIGRGLFRAWLVVSVLWIVGVGAMAYVTDVMHGSFQPNNVFKDEVGIFPPYKPDQKTFREIIRSPSAEKLSVTFFPVGLQDSVKWDENTMSVEMPDGSHVYMNKGYSDADKDCIAKQFWDQRWRRYGYTAGLATLWAVVPCIALFILGYVLLWIGRGFKRA